MIWVVASSRRVLSMASAVVTLQLLAVAAAKNCTTRCGNISIEYPFGVEPGCYHAAGFNLTCNHSYHPPMLFLGDGTVQVLDISIPSGTVRINSSLIQLENDRDSKSDFSANVTWGGGLPDGGPYFLSAWESSLAMVGCNAQVEVREPGERQQLVASCTAICPLFGEGTFVSNKLCSGVGCCKTDVPFGHSLYRIHIHGLDSVSPNIDVYMVDQGFNYTDFYSETQTPQGLPALLDWVVSSSTSMCPSNTSAPECRSAHSSCRDTDILIAHKGYRCECSRGYQGNPYITDGCYDIDECKLPGTYACYGHCNNTQGGYHCDCPPGFEGNASTPNGCKDVDECLHPEAHNCYGICKNMPGGFHCLCPKGTYGDPSTKWGCNTVHKNTFTGLSIALVVSGGSILMLLAFAAPFIARKIKLRTVKRLKEKRFKQNHGLLLQQLISQRADIGERMLITLKELDKATDNFDKTREVGGGGHGIVYKGILDLHQEIKDHSQREINEFINEIAILSQINHRNVVKLLGCCLETEVPLLVYEFISNGTLCQHLHIDGAISLSWDDRLRIAQEVARALSYLHSAALMPIFHRDIKSSNILLDDNLTAKVSDFGASRYIPIDQSGVTTAIQGTIGYLDPMYYYTGRLTDKSDVFSFGVLVIELLTRKKPFIYRSNNGDSLISHFGSLFTERKLVDIIDPQVMEEDDTGDVQEVAALAVTCTKLKGEDRPTMREVEMALENLRVKHAPCNTAQNNRDHIPALGSSQEASRQYSTEREMMLSARHPQ